MRLLPSSFSKKKFLTYGGVGLAIIILAASAGFFFIQYQNAQKKVNENPELAAAISAEKQRDELIKKVSQLVEVPGNETPVIATVEDKTKLNKQEFYSKTENGDRVLLYKNNKIAILYRPSSNRIINLATDIPISDATPSPTPIKIKEVFGATDAPSPSPNVIFNKITPTPPPAGGSSAPTTEQTEVTPTTTP